MTWTGVPAEWAIDIVRAYLSDDLRDALGWFSDLPDDAEDVALDYAEAVVEGSPTAVMDRAVQALEEAGMVPIVPTHCSHPGRAGHSLRARVNHYRGQPGRFWREVS